MTLTRILGWVGRAMITSGVILLLFVAYQLWGTGIHTRAAQSDLENQFGDQIAALGEAEVDGSGAEPDGSGGAGQSADPTDTSAPASDALYEWGDGKGIGESWGLSQTQIDALEAPEASEAAGRIRIPEIGSDWWYVEGVDLTWLRDGPGHFPGTSWPGQEGNAALAGHRTTYGAPFHRVDELDPGDEILVETIQGEFRYEVMARGELAEDMPIGIEDPEDAEEGHFIIGPSDSWILDDYGDDRLTLMACHPKYSAAQRIVVVGELEGEVAPTTPPSEEGTEVTGGGGGTAALLGGEDLLGNESSARIPALLWGLAAGAVWFTAWQIGRTWRKVRWPAYILGTPLFLAVLFGCFTQVERLLPAAY